MSLLQSSNAVTPAVSDDAIKSLRFSTGDYLTFTPKATGNNKVATLSFWMKNCGQSGPSGATGHTVIFAAGSSTSNTSLWQFKATDPIFEINNYKSGPGNGYWRTSGVYRDYSAWQHFLISYNGDTAAVKLFVNGEETTFTNTGDNWLDDDVAFNTADVPMYFFRASDAQHSSVKDVYLAEVYWLDGTAVDNAAAFGETNEDTNQWQPKAGSDVKENVTFGVNGFYQSYNSTELFDSFPDSALGANVVTAFTSTGAGTWTCPTGISSIELLVVAGGAGGRGGSDRPCLGGGGAGGVVHSTAYPVTAGVVYDLSVGAGGGSSTNGTNSVFNVNGEGSNTTVLTANGGGTGGGRLNDGSAGGSGGGGGGGDGNPDGGATNQPTSFGTPQVATGYGGAGAGGGSAGAGENEQGGGGGGASGVDGGKEGGNGREFSTFSAYGTDTSNSPAGGYFGGGGGGSRQSNGGHGSGGYGGGGTGRSGNPASQNGGAGIANTGGGGGAAKNNGSSSGVGGTGGSGIVLIAYFDATIPKNTITAVGNSYNQRGQPKRVTAIGESHLIGPPQGTSVLNFDGTTDYLVVAAGADWGYGTGDFTIEFWANIKSGTGRFICANQDANGQINFAANPANGNTAVDIRNDAGANVNMVASGVFYTNKWHHIVATRDGSTFRHYVDGVQYATGTPAGNYGSASDTIDIGRNDESSYLNGYLAAIRFSKGVCRYPDGTTFTPPTDAFVSDSNTTFLLQSGTDGAQTPTTDTGNTGHTITYNGDVRWFAPKIGTGAMVFTGAGASIAAGSGFKTSVIPFGDSRDTWRSSWTLEYWIKWNDVNTFGTMWGVTTQGGTGEKIRSNPQSNGASVNLNVQMNTGTSNQGATFTGCSLVDHTWYHFAYVCSSAHIASSGLTEIEFFLDGTSKGTLTLSPDWTQGPSAFLAIGYENYETGSSIDGYIDEFSIEWGRIKYTSNFTPTTTAFEEKINRGILLHGDEIDGTWSPDTSTGLAISEDSRFDFDGSGDYLTIPHSSDWNFGSGAWTVEFWVKTNTAPSSTIPIAHSTESNSHGWYLKWDASNMKFYTASNTEQFSADRRSKLQLGVWTHVALSSNGTTLKAFLDGVQVASVSATTIQDVTETLRIGGLVGGSQLDGYMDEVRISNTARYTSAFTPKVRGEPFEEDSNTKLLLHSDYTGGLGADSSGNYNNFTPTNLVVSDLMLDNPNNNFATLNPLALQTTTLSEGNLKKTYSAAKSSMATIGVNSGKWYWEIYPLTTNFGIGVTNNQNLRMGSSSPGGDTTIAVIYSDDSQYTPNSTQLSDTLQTPAVGDIYAVALDVDAETLDIYQNGTKRFEADTFTIDGPFFPTVDRGTGTADSMVVNFGQDSSFAGNVTAQGNGGANEDFYYTPPSGYKALSTSNLPAPSIALPGENFNTVIWTGNDADNRPITGLGFSPDITWNKRRSAGGNHQLQDVIRGAPEVLTPNQPYAEATEANSTKSFDADGFTVGTDSNANGDGITYVAWCWKAGGTPTATNSAGAGNTPTAGSVKINGSNLGSALAGSIPATKLSANTTSGFSIVEYSGVDTPSTNTIAHGLSVAPELYIIKSVGAASPLGWIANTTVIDGTVDYLVLNTNAAKSDQGSPWSTLPTASVFTLGANDGNTCNDGVDYVAYCFHSVEGYSKVGIYEGNANADGPFVYTGFKPAMVIIKQATTSNWFIYDDARDTFNVVEDTLKPSTNDAETDVDALDFVSNGFKLRHNSGSSSINDSGVSIIYLALAESAFKTSNAR